ncbi:GDSL-type esterase/lipase family protein [Christiangramia crocea]|uniref:GDSL-type esterase/lipase family protein n=1 Tax=Christiangramia crocea TaxID=2904124 RepID=A0A9X2A5E0_9FLAO|nr:GDSL-type esterase/lipase family protein [Gramella crocea]MCG9970021.1 GDSL-type esterase/lipase family protein [Gramella crocea]
MKKALFITQLFICTILLSRPLSMVAQGNDAELYPTDSIVSKYHNDWTQNHYRKRIEIFRKNPLQYNEIVFIGNSITEQGRDWGDKFGMSNIRNRGISGDLTDGVLKRLEEIVHFEPNAVFLLIGINDLFNMYHKIDNARNLKYDKIVPSVAFIGKNILEISKIIKKESPLTKVFVRTVLPTQREFLKDDIIKLNNIIRENENKGYYKVIDLYKGFVDRDGFLNKKLTIDGVHLSPEGYTKWVALEKPILKTLN